MLPNRGSEPTDSPPRVLTQHRRGCLPGPGASRRPRCGHSLAQGTGGSGGDKTDGGWDNEGGRSASPDGPAVGVGAFLTLRTEVCRSAGRREPALG